MSINHRIHLRRKNPIAVTVRSVTAAGQKQREVGDKRWLGLDVSAGGFGLEAPILIEIGDVFEVELHLPGMLHPVAVGAVARNSISETRGSETVFRVGLEFIRISDADRKLVANYAKDSGFII